MATTDQRLRPCVHLLAAGPAASGAADVHAELRRCSVASADAQNAAARLAQLLQDARAALALSASSTEAAAAVRSVDDIASYERALTVYLSLVRGFFEAPVAASTPADATVDGSAALQQPLIEPVDASAGVAASADDVHIVSPSVDARAACLRCYKWTDVLSDAQLVALDARHEFAHALLAVGLRFMGAAQLKADDLLTQRLSETDEAQLKLAYQLLLHAAGVLTACLESIGVPAKSVGAPVSDLGEGSQQAKEGAIPDEDEVAKWRDEQQKIAQVDASGASTQIEMLDRVPDLAGGHFPQLLLWIALAQAQELVLLRGVSREAVDFSLMAKLAMDLSMRYKECHTFAVRTLQAPMGSAVADRLRLYCAFKAPYYQSISAYFQGAAAMAKEAGGADAQACAIAIADFKKAKALLVAKCVPYEKEFETKLASQRDQKPRVELLRTVFARAEQVIDRDLDIMTHRNDSVYYQPIPEPEAASEPVGLVRAVTLPTVHANPIWTDRQIATCLAGPAPSGERAADSSKPREGCCQSCIIS